MWAAFTGKQEFLEKFRVLVGNTTIGNDERAAAVEALLLQEAVRAKVVKEIKIRAGPLLPLLKVNNNIRDQVWYC